MESGIETVICAEGVETIIDNAFCDCTSLKSITIPGVKSIGSDAFKGCTSLTSFTIPSLVTSLYSETFSGCTNLESVSIGNNVTAIYTKAFYNCRKLKSIVIPESVTDIYKGAFAGSTFTEIILKNTEGWQYGYEAERPFYTMIDIPWTDCTEDDFTVERLCEITETCNLRKVTSAD